MLPLRVDGGSRSNQHSIIGGVLDGDQAHSEVEGPLSRRRRVPGDALGVGVTERELTRGEGQRVPLWGRPWRNARRETAGISREAVQGEEGATDDRLVPVVDERLAIRPDDGVAPLQVVVIDAVRPASGEQLDGPGAHATAERDEVAEEVGGGGEARYQGVARRGPVGGMLVERLLNQRVEQGGQARDCQMGNAGLIQIGRGGDGDLNAGEGADQLQQRR